MATCRTCAYLRKCIEKATKEGYEHNVDFDQKDECTGIGFKSNTNADRIRAMSDEELAKWIDDMYCQCVWCDIKKVDCNDTECTDCIVAWLQQPTEVY